MRLIVAEKPSLARAIAAALPGEHRRSAHHITCATGDVVAWCAGHVLELAPPEDYSEALRSWTFETLPIFPRTWKHRVSARELVDSLERLLAKASRVLHAGDPDREGQLLVDEVLLHLGWRGPTERVLLTDLSPSAVRRALDAVEPNDRYRPLYEAALGRQRADWLYGMNLTRLYTLRARLAGYRGTVSVGRVQTPVLGLIVRRDREIENFVSKPFFAVEAVLRSAAATEFRAEWAVGKEHEDRLDAEGRLLDRELAGAIASKVAGQIGSVTSCEQKPESESAPLPYSLAALQIDAGRKLGWTAARVLEVAQRLYERQLLTYPRSDCSHLPEAHWEQARGVLAAVRDTAAALGDACAAADVTRRSKAWADSKVTCHHAIIPTAHRADGELDVAELALYELVARRYIQQFLLPAEYLATRVEILVAGERFVAKGRRSLALGWKAFEGATAAPAPEDLEEEPQSDASLPPLVVGERVACPSARVVEKRTKAPKAFTDATLIQAMCNVARFVADPRARKILQETDGIGTPATRADVIETLFERGYVVRQKKQIRSTPVGRALIDALPAVATTPDQTAVWEVALRRINDRQLALDQFIGAVTGQLGELVARGAAAGPLSLPSGAAPAPPRSRSGRTPRRSGKRPRSAGKASGRSRSAPP